MGRLVVVSNRVDMPRGRQAAGGLAVALGSALKARGGLWVGWSGKVIRGGRGEPRVETGSRVHEEHHGNIGYVTLDLDARDHEEYYHGFANRTLWPLFHYRPGLTDFVRRDMGGYQRVNRAFARLLAERLQPDDRIWVHDYHLIPLAAELRRLGVTNRIGFFLHIPWPAADLIVVLPNHAELVRGLAAYDLVGFQTDDDVTNFLTYLMRETKASLLRDGRVQAFGRTLAVEAFPVGIDTEAYARIAAQPGGVTVARLLASVGSSVVMIGVDRLDYSKGIPHRLEAVKRFIELHPEYRRRFTLLQIAPKSRDSIPEYAALEREVAELTGRINGAHGELDWQPIRSMTRAIARRTLASLYRASRIGLVTPLRDGMNLVAKEYVAAQDPEDPGVLVLSRFAGAAKEMKGALIIHPYDTDGVAEAIKSALDMDRKERQGRWSLMYEHLTRATDQTWADAFLAALEGRGPLQPGERRNNRRPIEGEERLSSGSDQPHLEAT